MLLVEDDQDTREILTELLSVVFQVIPAENGIEALEKARTEDPHLVVTDESLPGMTGTLLARTLRAEGNHVPIILVTGFRSGLDTSACDLSLSKPIEVEDLIREALRLLAGDTPVAHPSGP